MMLLPDNTLIVNSTWRGPLTRVDSGFLLYLVVVILPKRAKPHWKTEHLPGAGGEAVKETIKPNWLSRWISQKTGSSKWEHTLGRRDVCCCAREWWRGRWGAVLPEDCCPLGCGCWGHLCTRKPGIMKLELEINTQTSVFWEQHGF